MNQQLLEKKIGIYEKRLISENNNIKDYCIKKLNNFKNGTKLNHLISISKIFETEEQRINVKRNQKKDYSLNHNNVDLLTKNNMRNLFDGTWWKSLSKGTQKLHLNRFKEYIKYSKRKDLLENFPEKIDYTPPELQKKDLITRDELKLILQNCGLKTRTLIIMLYEGAFRIDELLSVVRKDIVFDGKFTLVTIRYSKTKKREVPLFESTPYINEYLHLNEFNSDERIFKYKRNVTINSHFNYIAKKLTKKYPKKWSHKKLNPHLFRHSRLTELASIGVNEPIIREFAGWSRDSTMPKVYLHLSNMDVRKAVKRIYKDEIEVPIEEVKIEIQKPKKCPICNTENNKENLFCWKCGNVFKDEDKKQMAIEIITQPKQIEDLRTEMKMMRTAIKMLLVDRESRGFDDEKQWEFTEVYKSALNWVKGLVEEKEEESNNK